MQGGRARVVVIGAGIGGLAAALRLAQTGLDVTLVEAAFGPGGKMRTLPSPAGPVDAGPTVLTMRPVFEALFADAGARLQDHVTLVAEPVLARHFWADGAQLDLHADPETSAAAVRSFGGAGAEADFRAFSARAALLYRGFEAPMMHNSSPSVAQLLGTVLRQPALLSAMGGFATLAQVLARQFRDPRLRQLFGRYATYVGGSPYQSPAVLGLIWQSEAQGVWRVAGGMQALARAMADLAVARGVALRYGCTAARIEVQFGRTVAVILADGTRLPCGHVVFNGDPAALAQGLLGLAARQAVPAAGVAPRSLSAWVWAFAARPAGPALVHHNVFFGRTPGSEFDDLRAGRMPADPTLYLCAQDAHSAGRGLQRFEIILNGPAVTTARPPDSEAETCRTRVFQTLARHGLTFDPAPSPAALTSPHGFAALFPGSGGSLYGRSPHGLMASFRRPRVQSRLPGLLLAGGGVHPGAGVPMAALSGRHAAEAILRDLASTSASRRTAMPGGTSTASATTNAAP